MGGVGLKFGNFLDDFEYSLSSSSLSSLQCEKTKVELQCISLMSDAIAYGCP